MRRTVTVLERSDVVYTQAPDGSVIGWIVLADATLVRLGQSEIVGSLDGAKARAAIAQTHEHKLLLTS